MSSPSTPSHPTSGLQASFSDVRKRRTQHPNMATATVTSGNDYKAKQTFDATSEGSSSTSSVTASDEQPFLPKSASLASEEASKKHKPKPPMLDLSIRNVYYTHSDGGKSAIGSPGSPTTCELM
ncbi:hypothetical protein MMC22_000563 [Lobaria immixta]|nr:hypothetical protein [Lobaria immixta]